jgi:hypothetical protein
MGFLFSPKGAKEDTMVRQAKQKEIESEIQCRTDAARMSESRDVLRTIRRQELFWRAIKRAILSKTPPGAVSLEKLY